jgi:DNA-binding transcriptional ArsR family regulator
VRRGINRFHQNRRERAGGLPNPLLFDNSGIMEKLEIITALAALAQESRLDIFRLLVQQGVAGMPAGMIGDRLGLPGATLSFHLAQLKHAGLITCQREGRSLIYAAAYERMNGLIGFLTENCCQGAPCAVSPCSPEILTNGERNEQAAL